MLILTHNSDVITKGIFYRKLAFVNLEGSAPYKNIAEKNDYHILPAGTKLISGKNKIKINRLNLIIKLGNCSVLNSKSCL